MTKYLKIFYPFLLTLSFLIANNYITKAQDNVYNEEINVIAPYEPSISDAFKINRNPEINDTIINIPKLTYSIKTKEITTSFSPEPIRPAKMLGEPLDKLYKGLIKLGIGTYTTPYGEFFYNKLRSKKYSGGIHYKHISSTGKIKNFAPCDYSNNALDLYGKKFIGIHTLYGNFNYNRDVIHFYGYNPDNYTNLLKNDTKQIFSLFKFQTKLESAYPKKLNKLNHSFALNYYNLSDNYKTKENNVKFNSEMSKDFKLFNFTRSQTLELIANVDYYNTEEDTIKTIENSIIKIQPCIITEFKEFVFKLGINTSVTAYNNTEPKFYPVANIDINVVKNVLIAYGGITGGIKRNNFKLLSNENPFISSTIPLEYTYNKFKIFGGFKTSFSSNIAFNANISSSKIDNMPFFVNDTTIKPQNKFIIVYDNVKLINAKAEISYHKNEKIELLFCSNFYNYSFMEKEWKPWYKPNFDASLSVNYNIKNKFILKANIFACDKMYAKTFLNNEEKSEKIHGIIDLNLGIEYRYNKLISGFINFNNIGNTQYYKWYNYPTQRFNLLAGISYAF
jgi:hypothetical protein